MSLIGDIRAEDEYKKFKKVVLDVQSRLKIEDDKQEALTMFSARTSRKLYGNKQYSPRSILDATANDMTCRSRLVEIRLRCNNHLDLLSEAIKVIRRFVSVEFEDELKKYKTITQRNAFIDRIISSSIELKGKGEALNHMLDAMIKDIDQTNFQISHIVDVLKLLDQSKGGRVV